MLDLDFAKFSAEDFLQMFATGVRVDAAAIFGQSVYSNRLGFCAPYDITAWRPNAERTFCRSRLRCIGAVQAGHSGFPVIFASALRAARPQPTYSGHAFRQGSV